MDATLPFQLNNPRFLAKWEEYTAYRKERRLSKLLSRSTQKQWDHLADFGVDIACEAIDQTIRNNWQGLFPERIQADRQPSGVRTGSASLGALQMELQRKREALLELTNPGGCAFSVQLTGAKLQQAEELRTQIVAIRQNMDRISTRK